MSDTLEVFRDLILWLFQNHEKPWDYTNETAKLIADQYRFADSSFFSEPDLEISLPSKDNVNVSFPKKRFFYLKPVTQSKIMVPRIQLKCDFGRNIPEVRCRLELFLLDDELNLQSLGYRFESPEGQNDEGAGIHHYYHIQIIQPPTARAEIEWLPETQPAFPINADNPVTLILSLLISLYGLDYLRVISRDANILNLNNYIKDMACIDFGVFEWYRLVEIGVKHTEGYRFTADIDKFETDIRKKYAGCKIRGISRTGYDSLNKSQQKKYP